EAQRAQRGHLLLLGTPAHRGHWPVTGPALGRILHDYRHLLFYSARSLRDRKASQAGETNRAAAQSRRGRLFGDSASPEPQELLSRNGVAPHLITGISTS